MKHYEKPELDILLFTEEDIAMDVLRASTEDGKDDHFDEDWE